MATSQSLLTVRFYSFRYSILYTPCEDLSRFPYKLYCTRILQALPCKGLWRKVIRCCKTVMLERKRHTGSRKTKKETIWNDVRLLFGLSQCVPYSTACRFCTTWITGCKDTIGIPHATRVCNGCISFGCYVVYIIHTHSKVVILNFYSSTCFWQGSYLVALNTSS